MASSNSPLLSSPSSIQDLQQWVIHISKTFETHIFIDTCLPVCIFQLPQTLTTQKPESYLPQHIGLGPIHHFRTELYSKQQQLKLVTAKTVLNSYKIMSEFEKVVLETLKTLVPQARWCYNLSFNMDDDTLAWVFALDGLFLFSVLSKATQGGSSEYSFEDVMMLENQIPFVVLLKLEHALKGLPCNPDNSFPSSSTSKCGNMGRGQTYLYEIIKYVAGTPSHRKFSMPATQVDLHSSSTTSEANTDELGNELTLTLQYASDSLETWLVNFCETRSPIKYPRPETINDLDVDRIFHLLDCMYHLIVKYEQLCGAGLPEAPVSLGVVAYVLQMVGALCPGANVFLLPVLVILKFPWDDIIGLVKKILGENLTALEIDIPTATKLSRIGKVEFCTTELGIQEIRFDEKKLTFFLPVLDLKSDSELILRNLVAYERLMFMRDETRDLILNQYVDLMCGIVDGVKDVKILREKGIIKGDLGDEEIVKLFKGISKSSAKIDDEWSKVQYTIAKVNKHYGNVPSVKVYRFFKKLFLAWWKIFAIVLPILSIVLTVITRACEVYDCKGHFGLGNTQSLLTHATANNQLSEI